MQVTVYGIPNCDTVKKARVWLGERQIAFAFHDFKKMGLERATVQGWLQQLSRELLVNRKGTTWRALDQAQKDAMVDDDSAIALMLAHPSLIKRPVLAIEDEAGVRLAVGFSDATWREIFPAATTGAGAGQP